MVSWFRIRETGAASEDTKAVWVKLLLMQRRSANLRYTQTLIIGFNMMHFLCCCKSPYSFGSVGQFECAIQVHHSNYTDCMNSSFIVHSISAWTKFLRSTFSNWWKLWTVTMNSLYTLTRKRARVLCLRAIKFAFSSFQSWKVLAI